MQIWMFQKIIRFSTFQTLPQNEEDANLDVAENFKTFNFSDPLINVKNADLNVSEDFKVLTFWTLQKTQIWMVSKILPLNFLTSYNVFTSVISKSGIANKTMKT